MANRIRWTSQAKKTGGPLAKAEKSSSSSSELLYVIVTWMRLRGVSRGCSTDGETSDRSWRPIGLPSCYWQSRLMTLTLRRLFYAPPYPLLLLLLSWLLIILLQTLGKLRPLTRTTLYVQAKSRICRYNGISLNVTIFIYLGAYSDQQPTDCHLNKYLIDHLSVVFL